MVCVTWNPDLNFNDSNEIKGAKYIQAASLGLMDWLTYFRWNYVLDHHEFHAILDAYGEEALRLSANNGHHRVSLYLVSHLVPLTRITQEQYTAMLKEVPACDPYEYPPFLNEQ